jgi:hypothetical protein
VKTQAKKKTGRRGTHKKLEAAKRKVRGRVGRPPGTKKSNPKAAIKKSSREKSAAGSGMENPIQSIVFYIATLI